MPTYRQAVDDIAVQMGFDHDDALRSFEGILYNFLLAVNRLRNQNLTKHQDEFDDLGMADDVCTFIVPVTDVDVEDDVTTNFDSQYFDLPTSVYSLDYGGGISFVRYLRNEIPRDCPPAIAQEPFTQTTLASVHSMYQSPWQRPKSSRPYFSRGRYCAGENSKDRVYLFGVPSDVRHLLVGLYAAPDYTQVDPDEDIPLPPHLLEPAKRMVIDLERWALQIPQERLKNDGRDFEPNQQIRVERQISINDPSQRTE